MRQPSRNTNLLAYRALQHMQNSYPRLLKVFCNPSNHLFDFGEQQVLGRLKVT